MIYLNEGTTLILLILSIFKNKYELFVCSKTVVELSFAEFGEFKLILFNISMG